MLAYSVGFGGSMIWFGSSPGCPMANKGAQGAVTGTVSYPELVR
jgi:hypothetical protein